jgi:hypothetical protein
MLGFPLNSYFTRLTRPPYLSHELSQAFWMSRLSNSARLSIHVLWLSICYRCQESSILISDDSNKYDCFNHFVLERACRTKSGFAALSPPEGCCRHTAEELSILDSPTTGGLSSVCPRHGAFLKPWISRTMISLVVWILANPYNSRPDYLYFSFWET